MNLNVTRIRAAILALLAAVGGILVGLGYTSQETWDVFLTQANVIIGGILTLVTVMTPLVLKFLDIGKSTTKDTR